VTGCNPIRAIARELDIATLGSLHPNKRANTFRELVAGAPAFNAVSRSSLLLAQHPEDDARRVLVRGKGNLSRIPAAIDLEIAEQRFNANGYEFKVPHARDFQISELTIDDLIGDESTRAEHSKVGDACEIVEALLPRDGAWHLAKPIIEACAAEDIPETTVKRAKGRLHLEHQRLSTFQAPVEWRWPPTQTTHRPPSDGGPSGPSGPSATPESSSSRVPSANGRNPLQNGTPSTQSTQSTQATQCIENKRPQCGPSGENDSQGSFDAHAPIDAAGKAPPAPPGEPDDGPFAAAAMAEQLIREQVIRDQRRAR
jgi:hypothetical protein